MERVMILDLGGVLNGRTLHFPAASEAPPPCSPLRHPGGARRLDSGEAEGVPDGNAPFAEMGNGLPPAFVAVAYEALVALASEAGFVPEYESLSGVEAAAPERLEYRWLARYGKDSNMAPLGRLAMAVIRDEGAAPIAVLEINSVLFLVRDSWMRERGGRACAG